jgi:hypothetical protein
MAKNILREKSPSVGTGGPADEVKRAAGKEDHAILTV